MPVRQSISITVFILCLLSFACHEQSAPVIQGSTRVVKDDLERSVTLVREPKRLVSLAPAITEMLFALGLGERVVGVTTFCNYPPEAQARAKIGDTVRPSLERILALKPDVVLASRASQLEAFARQLYEVSIPLYVVDARSILDVSRALRKLGDVLGAERNGEAVARVMERQVGEIEARVSGRPVPKVLLVIQREPLMVPGTRTFLADLIQRAGGRLIGPEDAREGVTFSLESVVAEQPQFIVMPGDSGSRSHRLHPFVWPKLENTPAIENQQIYTIDADLIMRPGPRLVDGLAQLAQILHPEGHGR
jgi:iron complex transport system substrate-binding protein